MSNTYYTINNSGKLFNILKGPLVTKALFFFSFGATAPILALA
jgi:hypothetical protein